MSKSILIGGLLLVLVAASATLVINSEYEYKGSSFEPFPDATDFSLTDQFGNLFRLNDQRGKVVLLFFGYTHCPDVCPATLAEFSAMRSELGEAQARDVVFVFVTEDPDRDTPERLRDYLGAFDPAIIGLTGNLEELEEVWEAYHVAREIIGPDEEVHDDHPHNHADEGDYLVLHTSRVYMIDKQGRLRLTFPYELSLEDRLNDVKHLLSEE